MEIDISPLIDALNLSPDQFLLYFMLNIGWLPISIALIIAARDLWLGYIQGVFLGAQKYVLLAIDVPKANEQTPKAVENILAYLAAGHGSINLIDKWWDGKLQLAYSLEVVSIDGYTQFVIRAPEAMRNLVETAMFSQYPDAEITEIDDYVTGVPDKYPDEEYDIAGMEMVYTAKENPSAYPIKVYRDFIDDLGKPEVRFKDPMATLMDLCSSLRKGEQLWWQTIIHPGLDADWIKGCDAEVLRLLGGAKAGESSFVDGLINIILSPFLLFGLDMRVKPAEKKDVAFNMMGLEPRKKRQIEKIQEKASKIGYKTKIRFVYVGRKEVFVKPKVFNGFIGFMKQFIDNDLNSLKPENAYTMTNAAYFFKQARVNTRKNRLIKNYKNRSGFAGATQQYMSVEELATMWHFPVESVVKAPMIQKTPGKKAQPPTALPFEDISHKGESYSSSPSYGEDIFSDRSLSGAGNSQVAPVIDVDALTQVTPSESIFERKAEINEKGAPPANLPFG